MVEGSTIFFLYTLKVNVSEWWSLKKKLFKVSFKREWIGLVRYGSGTGVLEVGV
jgi:hypothetical protein